MINHWSGLRGELEVVRVETIELVLKVMVGEASELLVEESGLLVAEESGLLMAEELGLLVEEEQATEQSE